MQPETGSAKGSATRSAKGGSLDQSVDVVVVSPHLDDAVLSLGAHIARLAAQGRRVEVWTAFTRGPAPGDVPRRHRAFADYETRLAEDDRALCLLGAGARHLDLTERIWREPRLRSVAAAFRTPRVVEGFSEVSTLVAVIDSVLARPEAELFVPLGVGHHVDHVEVAVAALQAVAASGAYSRVGFYEDVYALSEAARRRHPVARRRAWPLLDAPGWGAPLLGVGMRVMGAAARGPSVEGYVSDVADMVWSCEQRDATGYEAAKLSAVAQYRSQVSRMGGMPRLAAVLRRAHRVRGGELVWRATPRGT